MTPFSRASSPSSKTEFGEDVAEHVEGEVDILAEHARRVVGEFGRGRGVDLAADILDVLGDLARRAAARALEGHVLDEMREAVLVGRARGASRPPTQTPSVAVATCGMRLGHDREAVRRACVTCELAGSAVAAKCRFMRPRPHDPGALADEALDRGLSRSAGTVKRSRRVQQVGEMRRQLRAARPSPRSTASGNFAGWAVASATTGVRRVVARAARGAALTPTAVCGSSR